MPEYIIPYGEKSVTFSAENVIFEAHPPYLENTEDPEEMVRGAIDHPVGTLQLKEIVSPGSRVAIIVDDITRPTPRKMILKVLLEKLQEISALQISIVFALGTHRPMTQEEIVADLGVYAEQYPIVNISYQDKERFSQAGAMEDGTPIMVYREILEADVLIGIGNIVPHIAAGWGGGAKIIMPGVCGEITTNAVHTISNIKQNMLETSGSVDNLFRREMEKLAKNVGLSFIVNTVLDDHGKVLGVFAGDFIAAHRQGVRFAEQYLCPEIPQKADILVVSANPANADFWQGAKPFIYAHRAINPGGTMIFLLSAEFGLSGCAPAHEETIRKYYNKPREIVEAIIRSGEEKDILGVGEAFIRIQTEGYCDTVLISDGLSDRDAALLGFQKANSIQEALAAAVAKHGEQATVGIIPFGGDLLCRVKEA